MYAILLFFKWWKKINFSSAVPGKFLIFLKTKSTIINQIRIESNKKTSSEIDTGTQFPTNRMQFVITQQLKLTWNYELH